MPEIFQLKLHRLVFPQLLEGTARFASLSQSIFEWRFANAESLHGKDLFSALMQAKDPDTGEGFAIPQLVSEAGLLIGAGSDTTVTAITASIFYLLHSPGIHAELYAEIRAAFERVDDIVIGPQLAGCRLLAACIDETMRLTPSVGSTLMREVLPGGLVVDGEWFPPGTDIGIPHYALHHNENYWDEPFKFQPKRFMKNESTRAAGTTDSKATSSAGGSVSAFTPFGYGRTSCIGRYLALQEISLVLARMIWLFEMRLAPGSTLGEGSKGESPRPGWKNEFQTRDRFVSMHQGPMVQFRRRG
jgi:cytochrome P450